MAKPILLIKVPNTSTACKIENFRMQVNSLRNILTDWHVLYFVCNVDEVCFTALSEQAASDIEIDNLREMLLNDISK